jgi:hypothetical protein
VEAEARLAHGKRCGDDHTGSTVESELDGPAAKVGASWSEPGDRGGRELRQRRIALGEVVIDLEDLGV